MEFERRIGEVLITVQAPDGVEVVGACAEVRSADRDAFLRAAEAVGGLDGMTFPERDEPWAQKAYAFPEREDGKPDASTHVAILEPPRDEAERPEPLPPHPFFAPLAERREREREARENEGRKEPQTLKRAGDQATGRVTGESI